MHRLGEIDAAEVTFGEHNLLSAQTGEVLISEVMIGELEV